MAQRAGVALKTVYLIFPSKVDLLDRVIGAQLAGDDHDRPLRERPWFQETLAASADSLLESFARNTALLMERAAAVLQVAEAAADTDPAVRHRRDRARHARRADIRLVAEALAGKAPEVRVGEAADVMYTLAAAANYVQLVHECGWTPQRYVDWLADTLRATLFPQPNR